MAKAKGKAAPATTPDGLRPPPPAIDVEAIVDRFRAGLAEVATEDALRAYGARFVGKSGEITSGLKSIGTLAAEARKEAGAALNRAKTAIEQALEARAAEIRKSARARELSGAPIDITLPGRQSPLGHLSPLTLVTNRIVDVFAQMGFEVAEGPEVELDDYNFTRLGLPPDHPARDMQDTFWVTEQTLLRTHTSPVQVRTMLAQPPPIHIIAPGVVYRRDDDVTHSPMFHQVEGLLVDEDVTFADLKGTLTHFAEAMFGKDLKARFFPSFFPFTEPSADMQIGCVACRGRSERGCRVCKGSGWLEILGCGMVDPVVFEAVGYDPGKYTGWAFGIGIERVAMLTYGVNDIRLFFENDPRFAGQFFG